MSFQKSIRAGCWLFLLFSLGVAAEAQARQGGYGQWEQLGRSYVDGNRDHDTIAVNNNANYRALALEVRGGTIEFQRVVVHFENGNDHDVEVRDRISSGRRTRVIDLPGDRRRIRSVEFWYSPGRWYSRPYVNLMGQRSAGGDPDGRPGGGQGSWVQLGRSYVDGNRDHDTIVVESNVSFRALAFEVAGGTIDFQRVVVRFDNGTDHEVEVPDRISSGRRTRVIDLPGDRRRIRHVEFWYSPGRWSSRPYVNLLGQRSVGGGGADWENWRWEVLGQAFVDRRSDRDRIVVTSRDVFRGLQLGVKGGAIEFQRVVVNFDNGQTHELQNRDRIPDRGRTRVMDLPGDRRRIRSVEFWYSSEDWRTRPRVQLWGRR
jgi:hypothetical protein